EVVERKLGLETNRTVFFTSAIFILLFLAAGVLLPGATAERFGVIAGWIARNLGWFYILAVSSIVGFVAWIAMSRFGALRLGPDDARPEYDDLTWFAMLFTAGIGTVLMFYGVAEPLSHFADNPLGE